MNERFKLIVKDDTPCDNARLRMSLILAGADILLIGLAVFAFIFVRYDIARVEPGKSIVSPRAGSPYVMTADFTTADNGGETGKFDFPGRFSHEAPYTEQSGNIFYYYDPSLEISIATYDLETGPVRVADVHVKDIARISTALAKDTYGKGQREDALSMANRENALFSITGDNYSERYGGAVLRNGVLYSEEPYRDTCVLNWDGTVDLYARDEFDLTDVMDKNPYQIWSFGPILVEDSKVPRTFDTDMLTPGRRAAFGYYEPGHYCFVLMEGEVTLESLSQTMQGLGCESAYALYGGSVARMTWDGAEISIPQEAKRACSDLITVTK